MMLQTQRLILRPLTEGNLGNLHALMSDPNVMTFWDMPAADDQATTAKILQDQLRAMAAAQALFWVMALRDGGDFVGCCDLSDIDPWHRRGEVGFILAKPFWGGGYASEAMQAAIGHARSLGLRRLSARIHAGNDRSARLLERLGFRREGVLVSYIQRGEERRDCEMFGLLL